MNRFPFSALILTLIALAVNAVSVTAAPVDLSHLSSTERSEYHRAATNGSIFYVNSTLDTGDSNPGNEICETATGNGICTLRAAIEEANDDNDHDIIYFNFPGAATIAPFTVLPDITNSVTIDGVTSSGSPTAACPTNTSPATLPITLSGANLEDSGLRLHGGADNSSIRGLNLILWNAESRYTSAITVTGTRNSVFNSNYVEQVAITCNNIGTNGSSTNQGNSNGLYIGYYSKDVTIGGSLAQDRNVISGNGIGIFGASKGHFLVINNYIGVASNGVNPIGNDSYGLLYGTVFLNDSYGTVEIGQLNSGNIIANNQIGIYGYSRNHSYIQYNSIHNNQRGGIRNSRKSSSPDSRLTIRQNSIFANGNSGIDLSVGSSSPLVTFDGIDDPIADVGFNAPVLWEVAASTQLRFSYTTNDFGPSSSYRMEVFYNDSCDPSGYGEGQSYQESFTVTPLADYGIFSHVLTNPLPSDKFITLTATNLTTNSTSEFSNCINETDETNFVIDSLVDSADAAAGNGICADSSGNCTLRAALQEVNATIANKLFRLTVDIPGSAVTILLNNSLGPLPTVNKQIYFDGTTKEGAACPTASTPAVKILRVRGTNLPSTSNGLVLGGGSNGSTIQGFSLEGFGNNGLSILSNNNKIYCGEFGSGLSGGFGNKVGVHVSGNGNIIGGTETWRRNVFARNNVAGIEITGSANQNSVLGNYIGLSSDGSAILSNANSSGIHLLDSANNNYIGATTAANLEGEQENVGFNYFGRHTNSIWIDGSGSNNYVGGNILGQFPDGTPQNLLSVSHAIRIDAPNTQVGLNRNHAGSFADIPNVVSLTGASGAGIWVGGDGARIRGNFVGVSLEGDAALYNLGDGIRVSGDNADIENNIIGNNNGDGIDIEAGTHTITGNQIGVEADGFTAAANGRNGIAVRSSGNTIGHATDSAQGNLLAYNGHNGVYIDNAGIGTQVLGNAIRFNDEDGIALGISADSNHFYNNSFLGNAQLPIDLANDGIILANDNKDVDTGSNDLMNRVIINSAVASSGNIAFTFNGQPNSRNFVEFYASPDCTGASGYTSLQNLFGFETDGNGDYSGSVTVNNFVATQGISAITSNTLPGTIPASSSEFADCRAAIGTAPPTTLQVNNPGDTVDSDGCSVSHCTLYEAILDANALNDANTIEFKTPMVINIDAGSPLPNITSEVHIDGTLGSTGATCSNGNTPANLKVSLVGTGHVSGAQVDGLRFVNYGDGGASDSSVRGLRIAGFNNAGVYGSAVDALRIECNEIGAIAAGLPANAYGVHLQGGSANIIGGYANGDGNIIAGNIYSGIHLSDRLIGGAVVGNQIGIVDAEGNCNGNRNAGITLYRSVRQMTIGGSLSNGNSILCNEGGGVTLLGLDFSASNMNGNTIRFNSIYANSDLGIDIQRDGVTPNDADDEDEGENGLLNYPTIDAADISGQVRGEYDGADGTYTIDVYQNDFCHPSGYGEGQTWLDSFTVTVSINGNNPDGSFNELITAPSGTYTHLTMTATDSVGNTSEFSQCFAVGMPPTAVGMSGQVAAGGRYQVAGLVWVVLFTGVTLVVLIKRTRRVAEYVGSI